jgi:hypothetical protein
MAPSSENPRKRSTALDSIAACCQRNPAKPGASGEFLYSLQLPRGDGQFERGEHKFFFRTIRCFTVPVGKTSRGSNLLKLALMGASFPHNSLSGPKSGGLTSTRGQFFVNKSSKS